MPRILLEVYVNLDPVPGAFHTPESAQDQLTQILKETIGHYKPTVVLRSTAEIIKDLADVEVPRKSTVPFWYES